MDRRILIQTGDVRGEAIVGESETAAAIWDSLPIESV